LGGFGGGAAVSTPVTKDGGDTAATAGVRGLLSLSLVGGGGEGGPGLTRRGGNVGFSRSLFSLSMLLTSSNDGIPRSSSQSYRSFVGQTSPACLISASTASTLAPRQYSAGRRCPDWRPASYSLSKIMKRGVNGGIEMLRGSAGVRGRKAAAGG